jgi:uncharacterized protein with von Willebrand factor type A (vWA) domain
MALVRGAVAVVVSDGFERGDPAAMVGAVGRIARLAHRLVWATPMMADPRYRPDTRALRGALPAIDRFCDISTVAAWESVPAAIAMAGAGARGAAARQFGRSASS